MITIKVNDLISLEQIITVLEKGCLAIKDDETSFKEKNTELEINFISENPDVIAILTLQKQRLEK